MKMAIRDSQKGARYPDPFEPSIILSDCSQAMAFGLPFPA